ncbi:Tryptophan synthase alpha chain [compost metagenome]
MDAELCIPALKAGINFIRLISSNASDIRLKQQLGQASGFVYCVSTHGTTGLATPDPEKVRQLVRRIRAFTALPVCVGFGIKSADDVQTFGAIADGVVVGSEIVHAIARGVAMGSAAASVGAFVSDLGNAVRSVPRAPRIE